MSSNSLWNPFMFSVFRDPRTFKNDDDGGGGNDDNDNQPSSAPAPTVFYNDYSDPSNPVLDTMSAVADRRSGDGSTSSSYALANDTNFTDTSSPAATFGESFAANRAAGNATFTHNGNLYTTDLAPDAPAAPTGIAALRPVPRPTNLLSSNEKALVEAYNAVPASDENYTPDSATMAAVLKSQDKTSAVTAPLTTSEQVAQYGGVDLDARDAATTAANNASAATAFDNSDFDYTVGTGSGLPTSAGDFLVAAQKRRDAGLDPTVSPTSSQATTPEVQVAGPVTDLPSSPDFAMPGTQQAAYSTTMGPDGRDPYDPRNIMPTSEQMAIFNGTNQNSVTTTPSLIESLDFRAPGDRKTLTQDILDAMVGNDRLSQRYLPESYSGYAANIPVGIMKGISTTASGLGQSFDQASVGRTNLTLARLREMGAINSAQEEFMIRQAGEEGQRMREAEMRPRDQSGYDAAGGLRDTTEMMQDYYNDTLENYEGKQNIYKNLKDYEDVVGFEEGQVDPQLLDAMQGQQNPTDKFLFGQGAGSTVKMDGTGFDPSTATQKTMEAFGTSAPILATAAMGPLGLIAGMGLGQQQIVGELSEDTNRGIDAFYQSGRLQSSPAFNDLIGAGNTEDQALTILKRRARDLTQTPGIVLGAGGTLTEASLLKMGLPGIIAAGGVEALQEGPGEAIASNQILASVLGFDTRLSRREMLEASTAGFGGGVSSATVAPIAGGSTSTAPVLDTTQSPTSGQIADSTVQSSYEQAADSMLGAGVSGVGDTTASEALILGNEFGAENVVYDGSSQTMTNEDTGFSVKLGPNTPLTGDASTKVSQGIVPEGAIEVSSDPVAMTEVDALGQVASDGQLGMSFPGSQGLNAAVNQKVKEGSVVVRADGSVGPARTPVSLGTPTVGVAPNVDTTSVGAASVAEVPAAGIETVLAPDTSSLDAAADSAQPAVKARDVLTKYNEDIDTMGVSSVRNNRLADAAVIRELIESYEQGESVNLSNVNERVVGGINFLDSDAKKIADSAKRLEKAGILGPVDSNGNQEILAEVAAEGLASNAAPAVEEDVAAVVEVAKSPDDIIAEQRAAATSLSTIPTRVAVGDTIGGLGVADSSGQAIGSSNPAEDIEIRGTTGGQFTNMNNDPIGPIGNAPYGEPVRRAIDNPDGTTTIQVGSRISGEGSGSARDNYVSAAVTLPSSATDEQKAAAYTEALANWKSNYEGATTSGDIETNTGKVVPNEDIATFKAATEIELPVAEEATVTEVVVDPLEEFRVRARSDLNKSKVITNTILSTIGALKSNGLIEEAAAYEAEANAISERNINARMASSDGTTVTEEVDGGATVDLELTPEEVAAADVQAVEELYQKADAEIDALMTPETTTNADTAAATNTDTNTNTNTAAVISQVVDPGEDEDEVVVDIDDDPVVTDDDPVVTADPEVPDIFVPTITTTDEDGNTITECPEGYMMMETEDGPMCQKIVTARSSIQRAGAGTRAYTGLSGNRGRKGPGQKRKTTTSSTYERVAPTTTNA